MEKKTFFLLTLFVTNFSLASTNQHLCHDLDMSANEYLSILRNSPKKMSFNKNSPHPETEDHPLIKRSIQLGERLRQWTAKVNEDRSPENSLRLSSPQTRRKFPIDMVRVANPTTIGSEYDLFVNLVPEEMRRVLTSSEELPRTIPVDDETFIRAAIPLAHNYKDALRYKMLIPEKADYIKAAHRDVRGYHYFVTQKIGANELRDTAIIPEDELPRIKLALIRICINNANNSRKKCENLYESHYKGNRLAEFYALYFPFSVKAWNRFFQIPENEVRKDIIWEGKVATIPFQTPEFERVIPFLRDNIEDEFKWDGWNLRMVFGSFPGASVVIFKPDVTPHVPDNNTIVMDANQPLEEYDSQWVIRHEFGHILGLPDCYHEFYDEESDGFVSYQLDVTDLMCSRAGNMNERIYLELKRNYQ